mmetsp:Transcript_46161/g.120973  ORF Transcript_46161/g.120973 Transcript_46161/m.120973 type:complete len:93 (+) Transcript_46161:1262-1540(+)
MRNHQQDRNQVCKVCAGLLAIASDVQVRVCTHLALCDPPRWYWVHSCEDVVAVGDGTAIDDLVDALHVSNVGDSTVIDGSDRPHVQVQRNRR